MSPRGQFFVNAVVDFDFNSIRFDSSDIFELEKVISLPILAAI